MKFDELKEIIKQASDTAAEDCKDVKLVNEHSYPTAFNRALSKRLTEQNIPIWLINCLVVEPNYCEFYESLTGQISELAYS